MSRGTDEARDRYDRDMAQHIHRHFRVTRLRETAATDVGDLHSDAIDRVAAPV